MWYNLYVNKSEAQNTAFNRVAILSYELNSKRESQSGSLLLLIQVRGDAEPLQVAGKHFMSVFSVQLATSHREEAVRGFHVLLPLARQGGKSFQLF